MANFIESVDERTKLAGANRLEVLLFSLGMDKKTGRDEVFGINVFKVREVMHIPPITHAPDMPASVKGMVSLRGTMVPVLDVAEFCGMEAEEDPKILIVTEYNRQTQGLLVHSVEHILRMEWSDMKVPPPMLASRMGGLITAVTELEDQRIVMVLDVERILAETAEAGNDIDEFQDLPAMQIEQATIVYADDSSMARKQIEQTLKQLQLNYIGTRNGREAWEKMLELAERAESTNTPLHTMVTAIITDVEMPEMDGYVLTRRLKSDIRFAGIPIIMHSSLSADANVHMGKNVGADVYVPKFSPKDLTAALTPFIMKIAK